MDERDPEDETTNVQTVGGVPPPDSPPSGGRGQTIELDVLESGTTIGRYVLKKVIGRGGMGVVYVALDPSLNRRIAIKILHTTKGSANLNDPEGAAARLLREAQAMATIGHPNLVQVHDVGTFMGSVFIAMEFVNGRTLREWNAETTSEDWKEILKVYLSAADALQAAHDAKLIHRDFKPDNVMLGFDSRVRVMDFGLARSTGERKPEDSMAMNTSDVLGKPLTATGMIMGTPAYMAPEQFLGEPTDERTDQFSFCVSLYEALYGHRPFMGKNMTEVAKAVMRGKIKLPDRKVPVPDFVLTTLIKGLQCTPEDRFDTMADLAEALTEPPERDFYHPWILYLVIGAIAFGGIVLYWFSAQALNEARRLAEDDTRPVVQPPDEAKWDEERVGILHSDEIDKVTEMGRGDAETCIKRSSSPASIAGKITLSFLLDVEGEVEAWRTEDSDVFDRNVSRCVMGMAGSWPFPKPVGGPAKVTIAIEIEEGKTVTPEREAPSGPIIPLENPSKTQPPK